MTTTSPDTSAAPRVPAPRPAAPAAAAPGTIETRLRQLWRTYTTRLLTRGTGWLVAACVGVIFFDLLLDWNLELASGWRVALLLANLALLAGVSYRGLIRVLPRFDPVAEALRVERAEPALNGLLLSGVQFADEAAYPASVSRELMRAVRRQAETRVATLNVHAVARRVALRAAVLSGLVALLAFVSFAAWRGAHLRVLAQRMFNPASQVPYPTNTMVDVLSGDLTVRSGAAVTLTAQARGVIPPQGKLLVRFGALGWESLPVTRDAASGQFRYELPRVSDTVDYYFRLGDGRSARHRVRVVRAPRVAAARVALTYPAYTKLAAQEIDTLNFKVPEGTQVTWHLKFSESVAGAELLLDGAEPVALQLAAGGREASLQMPAAASRSYQVALRWKLGSREYVEPGPRHYMQVVPDADPQVTLVQPSEDGKATLKKVIHLAFNARDDYALGAATIVFSVNDSAELRHPLGKLGDAAQVDKETAWPVTQQFPGLKVGDMLTFAVEVTDSRPGQPGRARSLSRRVQFVTDADYLASVLARQRKTLGQLRPLYIQEKEAVKALEKLQEKKP